MMQRTTDPSRSWCRSAFGGGLVVGWFEDGAAQLLCSSDNPCYVKCEESRKCHTRTWLSDEHARTDCSGVPTSRCGRVVSANDGQRKLC
jgi:hypothetical protein